MCRSVHDVREARQRILIIDDLAPIRHLLCLFFEQKGYDVETTDNGAHALHIFEAGRFHLVMTNYKMPGMNGLEVASAIRRRDPAVPIVLMTGIAHLFPATSLAATGITKVFAKPFNLLLRTSKNVIKIGSIKLRSLI